VVDQHLFVEVVKALYRLEGLGQGFEVANTVGFFGTIESLFDRLKIDSIFTTPEHVQAVVDVVDMESVVVNKDNARHVVRVFQVGRDKTGDFWSMVNSVLYCLVDQKVVGDVIGKVYQAPR